MQGLTAELVLDRMVRAVQDVRDRVLRATAAMDTAGIPYAVIGGNAVAAWVATVEKSAVRNTQDVDILIRRADLSATRAALESAGFEDRRSPGANVFLDGPGANARDSVGLFFAGEKRGPDDLEPAPDVDLSVLGPGFRVLDLGPLVVMALSSFRTVDRVYIRDLIDVGLIDTFWPDLIPSALPALAERLRAILANPDG